MITTRRSILFLSVLLVCTSPSLHAATTSQPISFVHKVQSGIIKASTTAWTHAHAFATATLVVACATLAYTATKLKQRNNELNGHVNDLHQNVATLREQLLQAKAEKKQHHKKSKTDDERSVDKGVKFYPCEQPVEESADIPAAPIPPAPPAPNFKPSAKIPARDAINGHESPIDKKEIERKQNGQASPKKKPRRLNFDDQTSHADVMAEILQVHQGRQPLRHMNPNVDRPGQKPTKVEPDSPMGKHLAAIRKGIALKPAELNKKKKFDPIDPHNIGQILRNRFANARGENDTDLDSNKENQDPNWE